MPKVLIYATLRIIWTFFFFPNDKNENRAHVHVSRRKGEEPAKLWIEPEVSVEKRGSLTDTELKQVIKIANDSKEEILNRWQCYKRGKEVKTIRKKTNKNKV